MFRPCLVPTLIVVNVAGNPLAETPDIVRGFATRKVVGFSGIANGVASSLRPAKSTPIAGKCDFVPEVVPIKLLVNGQWLLTAATLSISIAQTVIIAQQLRADG